ncbi:two-component system, chemotaxis family, sensor kinase CheA [Sphingomonas laterariae]|uniref:Chemotaxis protein CheA n=1 Tax=Edaphosphingomonas laterariae TaxID=861865 RepID=A0A239DBW3_9SPHN|nr:chemotaxis protein CheA [Sphingomonas laterariae]SNS29508.1 two-component system, chemotaxis family, sensor kinase CheA [Sphingomonas laterariae]
MTNEEIQGIFFQECDEGLASAEAGLMACRAGEHDGETINTVFRAVHSIKGGAGAFGFAALQSFTHHFETVLDLLRGGELALEADLMTTLLRAFDVLSDHVAAIRGAGSAPDDAEVLAMLQAIGSGERPRPAVQAPPEPLAVAEAAPGVDLSFDLDALLGGLEAGDLDLGEPAALPATSPWRVTLRPARGALHNGGEPLLLLRELVALGGEMQSADTSQIPTLDRFEAEGAYLGWTLTVPGHVNRAAIEEVFEFVAEDCELRIEQDGVEPEEPPAPANALPVDPPPSSQPEAATNVVPIKSAVPEPVKPVQAPVAAATAGQTIRVDLDKLDRLVNLVGELVITQAMLAQQLQDCGQSAIQQLTDLDHLTRELQDSAMSIRAQPVKSVFSRVPRIVRELEAQTGKRVRLELEGEATELDKTVIERIGEPLTHLIRNSVDHGIESPADRIAAGKDPEGMVRLAAEHRSGRIIITVEDDGKGIDRERVLALAVERGIVAQDARLTDEEIDNLIFAPGFSTAKAVSNISGRGVGMDVVRQNVQALGGRIAIASTPGKGSVFTLALPLTLAILDGMIVSVGDQTYVIPLTHIIESLRPSHGEVKRMGPGQHVLDVRGAYLPVLSVADQLGLSGAADDPTQAVLIVVETEEFGQAVLMVDAIVDQRQVVIKSLETNYKPVPGCAGATILGDGRVALILDVETLVALQITADEPPLLRRA